MDISLLFGILLVIGILYIYNDPKKQKKIENFAENKNCCGGNLTTKDPNIANLSKRIDIMSTKINNADNTMTKVEKQIIEIKSLVQEVNTRSASYEKEAKNTTNNINAQAQQNKKNQEKNKKLTKKLEMFSNIGSRIDLLNSQGIFS